MKNTIILSAVIAAVFSSTSTILSATTTNVPAIQSQQADDIDKTLDKFDRYAKRLSKLVDRVLGGDMEAVGDLQTMLPEGEKLAGKLENMKDSMSKGQQERLSKITESLMEVYAKAGNN